MLAILLIGVGVAIYYIFMYDTWYPNEQVSANSSIGIPSGKITGEAEGAH